MQTRREYAISLGLAKPTRGRMSREANAAIDKAIAKGMQFSDMQKAVSVSESGEKEEKKPDPVNFYGSTPAPRFDGGWKITVKGKSKDISGKEVCRNCMVSLDYHGCANPIVPDIDSGKMIAVMR